MKPVSLFLSAVICLGCTMSIHGAEKQSVLDYTVKSLDGQDVDMSKYKGKVLLLVNVASRCGHTPQYETLQKLHETYSDKGLVILAFPCNQFGKQEPGTSAQIREFCTANYGVTFDLFSKIDVNGPGADPLYQFLTSQQSNPDFAGNIGWNFEKFLVSREGQVVARFKPGVKPDAVPVISAIEKELGK